MEITAEYKWTMTDGGDLMLGLSCYWNQHGEECSADTFCVDISMFTADGTLTQHKTPQILHTGRLFW